MVGVLILLLVTYTFTRLLHVWAYTLNFSEASNLTYRLPLYLIKKATNQRYIKIYIKMFLSSLSNIIL